jgi:hypothetical protein
MAEWVAALVRNVTVGHNRSYVGSTKKYPENRHSLGTDAWLRRHLTSVSLHSVTLRRLMTVFG